MADGMRKSIDDINKGQGETPENADSIKLEGGDINISGAPNPLYPPNMTDDELDDRLIELEAEDGSQNDERVKQLRDEIEKRDAD